jgi:hypothetical protein
MDLVRGNEDRIIDALKPFAGTKFDSGTSGTGEVADFWWHLEQAIVVAGWIHLPWADLSQFRHIQNPLPPSGGVGATNVEVHIRSEERDALEPAASKRQFAPLSGCHTMIADAERPARIVGLLDHQPSSHLLMPIYALLGLPWQRLCPFIVVVFANLQCEWHNGYAVFQSCANHH